MRRTPRRSTPRRATPSLLAATAALALTCLPGAAHAGGPASSGVATVAALQGRLVDCDGDDDQPTTIIVTADLDAPEESLAVPCVVTLDLSGHRVLVHDVTVEPAQRLLVTSTGPGSGTLTAGQGTTTGSGVTATDAYLDVVGATVVAGGASGVSAAGGQITVLGPSTSAVRTTSTAGSPAVDLGEGGTLDLEDGGSLQASTHPGDPAVTAVQGTVLVDGGSLATDAVSPSEPAGDHAVDLGDGGSVTVADGDLTVAGPLTVGPTGTVALVGGTTTVGRLGDFGSVEVIGSVLRLRGTTVVADRDPTGPEVRVGPGGAIRGNGALTGAGQVDNEGVVVLPAGNVGVPVLGRHHRVVFDSAGGSAVGPMTTYSATLASGVLSLPAPPTRPDHDFDGWTVPGGDDLTVHTALPGLSTDGAPVVTTVVARWVDRRVDQRLAPTVRSSRSSRLPRHHGWYRTPVTVTFACTAGSSPVATCPRPVRVVGSGRHAPVVRQAVGTDGAVRTVRVGGLDLDLRAPTLRVLGVRSGASYDAPPRVGCRVVDAMSGAGRCRVRLVHRGSKVVYQVVGRDVAGNVTRTQGWFLVG